MTKFVSSLALAASLLMVAAQADASIVVDFSFNGYAVEPGSVTGHLVFDTTGTNVQATGVYIDTATASVSGYANYNFLNLARVTQNSFDLASDGTLISGALSLSSTYGYQNVGTTWVQLNGFGGYNTFEQDYTQYYNGGFFKSITNQSAFAGATFVTETPAAVPEPAAWAMLTLGFGLVGAAVRRRKAVMSFA